jgi:hypothetical protein
LHDGWVYQLAIRNNLKLCLDLPLGHTDNGNQLQIWECNGQEGQLWYFDFGTYALRYAGDKSKCVDAGSSKQSGNRLMLWDCNGLDQQRWGYDDASGAVVLQDGQNTLCIDLAGGQTAGGTAVQLYDCNSQWPQSWNLMSGIGLRSLHNLGICLDLEGGSAQSGTPISLWECNGTPNQHWIFDDWQIKYAADPSKCIDAGNLQPGNQLMLWDCNGQDQQIWGFDNDMGTIYLAKTATDALYCMDLPGGKESQGTRIEIWNCNGCWNQQFQVIGPSDRNAANTWSPADAAAPSAGCRYTV